MDWDRLRVFHTVAELKNITAAGQILDLSQSAVSRQVAALESEIGSKLFKRHARGIVLTDEGEILYNAVKNVFNVINTAQAKIQDKKDSVSGVLKIAATTAVATVWLPPRLQKFTNIYPELNLQFILTDGDIDFSVREADVAIRFGNNKSVHPDLVAEHLFDVHLRMYGSDAYFQKYGIPKKLEDLSNHHLIVYGEDAIAPADNVNMLLKIGAHSFESRSPFIQLGNAFGILQCVRHGLGIALLADYIAKDFDDLIPLFPDVKFSVNELIMVYPKELAGSKRIEAFLKFMKKNKI
ncbi:MAG: LysR family transcriptional regulator [Proteobacteria bacterium]|nr:LysR family transcriptional regulator [Pseudomonadota bacterium]